MGVIEVATEVASSSYQMQTREDAGVMSLGRMDDKMFDARLSLIENVVARLERIKEVVLTPGEDFDVVPGTKKLTLLKPGAEKLGMIAQLAPEFVVTRTLGDGDKAPLVHYLVVCKMHRGDTSGPVIGEGVGSCNSHETKYRYRQSKRVCPNCNEAGTIIKGKEEYGGGWLCFAKKGGCGSKFKDDDPNITGQKLSDIVNSDPLDLDNTLLKMAKKRAHVDAALTSTASSGMFTQDMEENVSAEDKAAEKKKLFEELKETFKLANITDAKVQRAHCERVMRGKLPPQSKITLAELRMLIDRLDRDDQIRASMVKNADDETKNDENTHKEDPNAHHETGDQPGAKDDIPF